MSNGLSPAVDAYIRRILPQAKKELTYVEGEDWSGIKNVKTRENAYAVHNLITDRNIKSAVDLYKMAGEDLSKKRVKNSLEILVKFFSILDERYNKVVENFDWTEFNSEEDGASAKAKNEVEFQSEVLKNLNAHEERLRKINFGGESDELHIEFHGDKPIPLMMSERMEEKYPDIQKYLDKKDEKK